jgi:hypothetical protein
MDSGQAVSFEACRNPFSPNYSKCLRQALCLEAKDTGSRARAFHESQNSKIKFGLKDSVIVTNAYTIIEHLS